jgi:hypothetical protein
MGIILKDEVYAIVGAAIEVHSVVLANWNGRDWLNDIQRNIRITREKPKTFVSLRVLCGFFLGLRH